MSKYIDLKRQREFSLKKADSIIAAAEAAHRETTESEGQEVDTCMVAVNALNKEITAIEKNNTLHGKMTNGMLLGGAGRGPRGFGEDRPVVFSETYGSEFMEYVQSNGRKIGAALYEGPVPRVDTLSRWLLMTRLSLSLQTRWASGPWQT